MEGDRKTLSSLPGHHTADGLLQTRLTEKMKWLSEPRSFIYDPNGVNSSQSALSHADVLKIFSSFLPTKSMMAEIIVSKFPFIFIDESQDTDKDVISAFFELQDTKSDKEIGRASCRERV